MTTKFVIISSARSGSNIIQRGLKNIENVICAGEIFNELLFNNFEIINNFNKIKIKYPPIYKYKSKYIEYLNKFFYKFEKKFNYIGFKILIDQNIDILKKIYTDKSFKIIFLYRKNLFKQYLSYKIGLKTNNWIKHKSDIKLEIDKTDLNKHFYNIINQYISILSNIENHRILKIFYEDLDLNYEKSFKSILKFLNIPIKKLIYEKQTIKQEFMKPSQRVINFDEIKKSFSNSIYIKYFVDELSSIYDIDLYPLLFDRKITQFKNNKKTIIKKIKIIFKNSNLKIEKIEFNDFGIRIYFYKLFYLDIYRKEKNKSGFLQIENISINQSIKQQDINDKNRLYFDKIKIILLNNKNEFINIFNIFSKEINYFNGLNNLDND